MERVRGFGRVGGVEGIGRLGELQKSEKMEEGEESEESEELEEVVKSGDLEDRGEWVWSATRARAIANRRSKRQSSCFRYNTAFYFKLRAEVPNCFGTAGQPSVQTPSPGGS